MSKVWVKGRARAKDVRKFEAWASELVEKIRTTDKGTLAFGVYPAGGGEYIFLELYKDSEAALSHLGNVGELLGRMGDVAEITAPLEVYGDINSQLRETYAAWNAVVMAPLGAV
ncbi:MAG TPA: antibiotic biosynthesis monooxygenase [Caulobacterales bacterium]|nr:antibiotic biosynthesis monooxygenase [Caulobacterales bacterium]